VSTVTFALSSTARAASYLSETYGWTKDQSERALEITRELSPSPVNRPTSEGYVTIICDRPDYVIEDIHRQ